MSLEIGPAQDAIVAVSAGAQPAKAPSIPPIPPPPAVANISPFGDLLGRLRELSQTSPATLRSLSRQIQTALSEAARRTPGPSHAAFADLASRFGDVARTGDISSLQSVPATAVSAHTATVLIQHVEAAANDPTTAAPPEGATSK